jgi:CheY-like chemotaxis protein
LPNGSRQMTKEQAPTVKRVTNRLPRGSETILVVEDDELVRNSIKRILMLQGYTVPEARHGAEALQIIDETKTAIEFTGGGPSSDSSSCTRRETGFPHLVGIAHHLH